MSKYLLPCLVLLSYNIWAQPVNDDCGGIIDLGVAPYCSTTEIFTNLNATATDIGNDNLPSCFDDTPERDVWFSFTASTSILEYTVSVIGTFNPVTSDPAITNPEIAVYRGNACAFDELVLVGCASAAAGNNQIRIKLPNLTPGIQYFIRINEWSETGTPHSGAFTLCVEETNPVFTVDQGGSVECSGEIFDSGGPSGFYGPNENNIFIICPSEPHECINLEIDYFNFETGSQVDRMIIYDGIGTGSPQVGVVPYYDFLVPQIGITGGGTGYRATASSGCMTLQFISDAAGQRDGFHARWECSDEPCELPKPISVKTQPSEQTIIENIVTDGATVTIDKIQCDPSQFGVFEAGDNTDLGMDKGLILTTGYAFNAAGPNVLDALTTDWGLPGDADLDALDPSNPTFDACVVELDVFVKDDELTFEYIFGSEEYPEFVNQSFNDVFSFFISGPGITGNPIIGGQENIARLPGTNDEVSINNVNHTNNWGYYRYNGVIGDFSPGVGRSIEYDGLTSDYFGKKKSLTARKKVTPCNTYHMKLVVADKGDTFFDSGVFISKFSGGQPNLDVTFYNGVDFLVEDCTLVPDELVLSLPIADMNDETSFDVDIGGTATLGEDYELNIPSTVTFMPGETELKFPITPIADGVTEGAETIEIRLVNDFGCGEIEYAVLNFEIQDNAAVEILSGQDTLFVCPGESLELSVEGASQFNWSPQHIMDDPLIQNPIVTPISDTLLIVKGGIGACEDADSIWLKIANPDLNIEVDGNTSICEGETVILTAENNIGNTNLVWAPSNNLTDPNAKQITVSPAGTTTFIAQAGLPNCLETDTVTIFVEPFDFPELTTLDTTICPGESFQLAENISNTSTIYTWSPSDNLEPNNSVSGPVATPETNTVYTLDAVSAVGNCSESASVNVEVLNFDPSLEVSDESVTICVGEETTVTATTSTFAPNFSWVENGDTIAQTASVTLSPTENTVYQVIATDGDNKCFFDETTVEVLVISEFQTDEIMVFDSDGNPLGSSPNLSSGQTISLTVNVNPNPGAGTTYEWSIDGEPPFLTTTENTTGTITAPTSGTNTTVTYNVIISDENGCTAEASVSVDITTSSDIAVFNVFTPDGDNLNDSFRLANSEGVNIIQFRIYNRWGELVQDGGNSWDGNYKGKPAPSDAYIYHIIYESPTTGEAVELKGDLTLIR